MLAERVNLFIHLFIQFQIFAINFRLIKWYRIISGLLGLDIGEVKYVVLDFLKLKITLFWRAITARKRKNLFQVVKLLLLT